ncbi:MAG: sporulation protein YqfD [Oscillospiraceae bacterium]|nr:sporulation protein YqfD [Oscillospiraceae bacterium]
MMFARVIFTVRYGYYSDFLNEILNQEITLENVQQAEYGFTACCYAEDYIKISRMAAGFQCRTKIVRKKGMYFLLKPYIKRKGLILSRLLLPVLCCFYGCVIWKIDIKTTDDVIKNKIACSLYNQGIYRGNICTKDKLTDAQRLLMLENKDLGYVTLNFYKGILTCEVYKRDEKKDEKNTYEYRDIVSQLTGVVRDVRVYRGFSNVQPGQPVSAGDILVRYNETDSKNRYYESQTAAYIAGECEKKYSVFIPYDKKVAVYTGQQYSEETVNFLGKEFNIKPNEITNLSMCTKQSSITTGNFGGFILPFTVKKVTYSVMEYVQISTELPEIRNIAQTQLNNMIINDRKLEKEFYRNYDYRLETDGISAVCTVDGLYIMT